MDCKSSARSKTFSSRLFWIGFVLVAILFFLGTLLLPFASAGDLFVSPDETANAFFANQFALTGSLRVPDPVSGSVSDILFPRSVVAKDGFLLPQSFVGLPVLYGIFVFFFGPWMLFVLTPLFAIMAALAFRRILLSWFSPVISHSSAILFLLHPAVWYYSARGLMHNVLFVCLLMFAVYAYVCRPLLHHMQNCPHRYGRLRPFQEHVDDWIAGLFIGFALTVRASEVFWVGGLLLLFGIITLRTHWKRALRVFVGVCLGILPFFVINTFTYGHPIVTGYTVTSSAEIVETASDVFETSTHVVFPFGIDLSAAGKHVVQYGLVLFWWLSALALLGFFLVSAKKRWYALLFLCVAGWLGIWYGSWTFNDNPDPFQITIANSYVRYWIPVFLLAIPLVAEGMVWIAHRARSCFAQRLLFATLMLLVIGFNIRLVFFAGQDALSRVGDTLVDARHMKEDVLANTPPESVIIVDRADKLFFPDRHVLYPLRSEATYAAMPDIAKVYPLYYFGITFPEKDMTYLNETKLPPLGLTIEHIKTYGQESLYQIK